MRQMQHWSEEKEPEEKESEEKESEEKEVGEEESVEIRSRCAKRLKKL